MFGAIFLLAKELEGLDASELLAWRLVATVPIIAVMFTVMKLWPLVKQVVRRLDDRRVLIPVLLTNSGLFGLQLWLFGWAPKTGHGLDLALGYLLMPLVLVAVGVALHDEKLSTLRRAALVAAGVGVAAAVVIAGGIGWSTLAVAIGFPVYFTLRRRARLNTLGAVFLEFFLLLACACVFLALTPDMTAPFTTHPDLRLGLLLLGVLSAAGFLAYLRASEVLSFAVFGLLGYLEPIILVALAVVALGEPFSGVDALVYGPILVGLILLSVEGLTTSQSVIEPNLK